MCQQLAIAQAGAASTSSARQPAIKMVDDSDDSD
jgi:hypothetical protein